MYLENCIRTASVSLVFLATGGFFYADIAAALDPRDLLGEHIEEIQSAQFPGGRATLPIEGKHKLFVRKAGGESGRWQKFEIFERPIGESLEWNDYEFIIASIGGRRRLPQDVDEDWLHFRSSDSALYYWRHLFHKDKKWRLSKTKWTIDHYSNGTIMTIGCEGTGTAYTDFVIEVAIVWEGLPMKGLTLAEREKQGGVFNPEVVE